MSDSNRRERLRRVRSAQEHAARGVWATAEARARDAQDRAARLEDTLTRARAELDALLRARALSDSERQSYETPLEVMQGHLDVARAELEVRLREAAAEHETWSHRRREERASERLVDRATAREEQARAAAEEREAEDLETRRRLRGHGSAEDAPA